MRSPVVHNKMLSRPAPPGERGPRLHNAAVQFIRPRPTRLEGQPGDGVGIDTGRSFVRTVWCSEGQDGETKQRNDTLVKVRYGLCLSRTPVQAVESRLPWASSHPRPALPAAPLAGAPRSRCFTTPQPRPPRIYIPNRRGTKSIGGWGEATKDSRVRGDGKLIDHFLRGHDRAPLRERLVPMHGEAVRSFWCSDIAGAQRCRHTDPALPRGRLPPFRFSAGPHACRVALGNTRSSASSQKDCCKVLHRKSWCIHCARQMLSCISHVTVCLRLKEKESRNRVMSALGSSHVLRTTIQLSYESFSWGLRRVFLHALRANPTRRPSSCEGTDRTNHSC